jgi:hypothetical protein
MQPLKIFNLSYTTYLQVHVGALTAPFTTSYNPGSFNIAPRATLQFTLTYTPTQNTPTTQGLVITSNDPVNPTTTVQINGSGNSATPIPTPTSASTPTATATGIATPVSTPISTPVPTPTSVPSPTPTPVSGALLSVPASITFPVTPIGQRATQPLKVFNLSYTTYLQVNVGGLTAPFGALYNPGSYNIGPRTTLQFLISYTPTQTSSVSQDLVITSNDPTNPRVTVQIIGSGGQ